MSVTWISKSFEELSPDELYSILQLRSAVFVVEQQCPFLDADDKDQVSLHLMGFVGKHLAAYARVVPPGPVLDSISIGRVVTSSQFRKAGIGRELMNQAIDLIYQKSGRQNIKISAQLYLHKFYSSFGFQQISDVYAEDGIDHIKMLLTPKSSYL